jgi:hypothetical protein
MPGKDTTMPGVDQQAIAKALEQAIGNTGLQAHELVAIVRKDGVRIANRALLQAVLQAANAPAPRPGVALVLVTHDDKPTDVYEFPHVTSDGSAEGRT